MLSCLTTKQNGNERQHKSDQKQDLDWIEKELSSYNPEEYIPKGIEDTFLEEDWGELEELYGDGNWPEPLVHIVQRILNEIRL